MTEPRKRNLVPAERVVPDPVGGWRGADLDESELVDDAYIAADPDSQIVTGPDTPREFQDGLHAGRAGIHVED